MIKYRHAKKGDYKEIISFLKTHWKEDHILVRRREVFNHFYFRNPDPQFFIAIDEAQSIVGILGYITNFQFDNKVVGNGAWLSIWKALTVEPAIGIKLLRILEQELKVDFIASLGVNKEVLPIYNRLGYQTGSAIHWKSPLKELKRKKKSSWKVFPSLSPYLEVSESYGKSTTYFENKYLAPGFYDYSTYSINRDNLPITNIVGRKVFDSLNNKTIFKIIDFSGDIRGISQFVIETQAGEVNLGSDFIDIIMTDINDIGTLNGFSKCDKNDYLPIYFEPLVSSYQKKNYCFKKINSISDDFNIVTGDCDQDRPNFI